VSGLEEGHHFECLLDVRQLYLQVLASAQKLGLHEFVLLVQLVHLREEIVVPVLVDPRLCILNENGLGNTAVLLALLRDWSLGCLLFRNLVVCH